MKSFFLRVFSSRLLRILVGTAISLVSIWLAVRNVSLSEVGKALQEANPAFVFLALASVAANQITKAIRWKVILGPAGRNAGLGKALMSILAGQALNSIYPARIGDVSRIYTMGNLGAGRTFTLGTIVLEKLVDLLFYSLLFAVLLLLIPLPVWIDSAIYWATLLIVLATALALLMAYRLEWFTRFARRLLFWLPARWRAPAETRLEAGLSSLQILQSQADLIKIFLLSGLIWSMAIVNNGLVLRSFNLSLPLTAPLLVLIVLQASVSLPQVIPAGIGLYEYLCILALSVFGVDQATALSYGLLLHAVSSGPVILLGLLFLFPLGLVSKTRQEQAEPVDSQQINSHREGHQTVDRHQTDGQVSLLGVKVHTLSQEELIQKIESALLGEQRLVVMNVNAHALNLAYEQPRFRQVLNHADVVFCDGFGVKWGALFLGKRIPYRYTPPDWMPDLCVLCERCEFSLYLLGARPGVAERAAQKLKLRFPGLSIAGTQHGFFDKRPASSENQAVIEAINQAAPEILVLGLGMPTQEYWIEENWEQLNVNVVLTTGAYLDYLAGEVVRSPRWLTDHGLEWLGRLLIEPRRLWRRYLVGNPLFLWRILGERVGLGRLK